MNKAALRITGALFPLIMVVIAFISFTAVYLYLIMRSIQPHYWGNLLFAVPFLCFAVITVFTATGKIETGVSAVLTGVLTIIFGIAMVLLLGFRMIEESTAVITDVGQYERVLKLTGYPGNLLTQNLPAEIPDSAENVLFRYSATFTLELKFDTDPDRIDRYTAVFSRLAQWEGKPGSIEAEKHGIFTGTFRVFGYTNLPADFTVYLFYGKPYRPGDWNHGEQSLAAVSRERNEIIFHAEDW